MGGLMDNFEKFQQDMVICEEQFDNIIEENLMMEMAMNLRQPETGLPMVIWVSTKESAGKEIGHACRIKVMNTHDQKAKKDLMYTLDVYAPFAARRPHGMKISSDDLRIAREWIKANHEALLEYWNDDISASDFLAKIKPNKK